MDYIRTEIWPAVKVRCRFYWWVIKYGGRKRIPRERVFEQMEKSFRRMQENLQNAIRVIPGDLDEEQMFQLKDLLRESADLEEEIKKAKQ